MLPRHWYEMRLLCLLFFGVSISFVEAFAQNPGGLRFEISLPEGRTIWRQGELIPLTLRPWSSVPDRWVLDGRMQDRIGRLNYTEEFRVEPTDGVRDPLTGIQGHSGGLGGISGVPGPLTLEPFEYVRDLNEWVEFTRPGTYRLTVLTRRVSSIPENADPGAHLEPRGSKRTVELTSNTLTLQIGEATPSWLATHLREAVAPLNQAGRDEESVEARRRGGRILRFLGSEQAGREMIRRLGSVYETPIYDFRSGVLSSPHGDALLPFMEEQLAAPEQAVDRLFVDTLTTLAVQSREGPMPPAPAEGPERERWKEQVQERRKRRDQAEADYYAQLAAALRGKQSTPRSVSAAALSGYARVQSVKPAWHSATLQQLRNSFRDLPFAEQRSLLSSRWFEIAGPEMIPLLMDLSRNRSADAPNRNVMNLAARRLYELDRAKGRRLIVDQIRNNTIGLELETLLILDDDTLPEVFDALVPYLRKGHYGADHFILRYGDDSFVDLAIAAMRAREARFRKAGQTLCMSALHLYVLKHAPDRGKEEFRRRYASNAAQLPHCLNWRQLMKGPYAWSPAFEELIRELPEDAPVIARVNAALLLGRYGSVQAKKYLWKYLETFYGQWEGREAELSALDQRYVIQLEVELRRALALGSAWILDSDGLERLRALCVSDWCRTDVDKWERESVEPLHVSVGNVADGFSVSLGRFHLQSKGELVAKVAQFPAGTRFQWSGRPPAGSPEQVIERIREIERLLPGLDRR